MSNLRRQIDEKKRELAELQRKLAKHTELTQAQQLAEELHSIRCHKDHTEGCTWHYENWETSTAPSNVRERYRQAAEQMLSITDFGTITSLFNIASLI